MARGIYALGVRGHFSGNGLGGDRDHPPSVRDLIRAYGPARGDMSSFWTRLKRCVKKKRLNE